MSSPPDRHVVYGWQAQSTKPLARIVRSERIYLWDAAGRRIMDFCSGQINVNVGYGHPAILAAMREQMAEMTYVAPGFETEPRSKLAALIAERLPAGLDQVFFTNSGSESVEVAIKISRAVTRRTKIYSAWRSYHGNSAGASAISGDPRRLFAEPAVPGVSKFHGATCYCCPFGERSPPGCGYACLSSLTRAVLLEGPETIAAIVVEPIVGTSGLYVPPAEYLRGIRRLCDEHGILLVFDETMTGWGRTGRWFAWEHSDVRPDMITTAKGITSAYVPLGATIMTARLREVFLDRVFVAGSSTEGHALGCAAGIANIQVYESEGLIEHSRLLGDYLLEQLRAVAERHPSVGDVRGKGLFACLELSADRARRAPLAGFRDSNCNVAAELVRRLFDSGLSVMAKWDYLFIAPPLVICKEEIDVGINRIDDVLGYADELVRRRRIG